MNINESFGNAITISHGSAEAVDAMAKKLDGMRLESFTESIEKKDEEWGIPVDKESSESWLRSMIPDNHFQGGQSPYGVPFTFKVSVSFFEQDDEKPALTETTSTKSDSTWEQVTLTSPEGKVVAKTETAPTESEETWQTVTLSSTTKDLGVPSVVFAKTLCWDESDLVSYLYDNPDIDDHGILPPATIFVLDSILDEPKQEEEEDEEETSESPVFIPHDSDETYSFIGTDYSPATLPWRLGVSA